mgnify:CR=1 FL=1
MLREKLLQFVTDAESIKGEVCGAKAVEERWSKRLVMSDDHTVIEIQPDGMAVDLTAAMAMACTAGFNADEALQAVSHTCVLCNEPKIGVSTVILLDVFEEAHVYWCRQCYSNSCRDNPQDPLARRKADGEEKDVELPLNQWKKDKGDGDNENRPC